MKLAVIAKSAWKDLPSRVDALAAVLSSKLPAKVDISIILKDYGDIPADANGRITAAFLDKTLAVGKEYDGACLLVSLSDRKKYGLKPTLRGHYLRDEDGYVEFWVASDRTTKRKGKPQLEETFSHELCHGLYHWLGIPDRTHEHHDAGSLDGAFEEIAAAWPKPKVAPKEKGKASYIGYDDKFLEWKSRFLKGMASIDHPMYVHEAYRSNEAQASEYAKGRTAPSTVPCEHGGKSRKVGSCDVHPFGATVTNAKPGQSKHNTSRAMDIVFDSKNPWADSHPWQVAGQVGESIAIAMGVNVSWGGRWAGFKDLPHWQTQ